MKEKALLEGRDLLVVDSGDLHDGTGLSDTTVPDGKITDRIFQYVEFDLLSVGRVANIYWLTTQKPRIVCGRGNQIDVQKFRTAL
jgi:hypothetical protein